jgi:hypothetical protein
MALCPFEHRERMNPAERKLRSGGLSLLRRQSLVISVSENFATTAGFLGAQSTE